MYIRRQKKNLKPCVSLQACNSKNVKASLRRFRFRKHIHVLYKRLSRVLPVPAYKIAGIHCHIAQASQASPARALTLFSRYSVRVDPFPDHIYPQLRSLKRARAKAYRRYQMEPLHWQSGFHPDRPFEHFQNNFVLRLPPPPRPSQARRQSQIPTQYYLEQAPFYAENHGLDPFATEPEVPQTSPLKLLVLDFVATLSRIDVPALNVLVSMVLGLLHLGRIIATWALRSPLESLSRVVGSVQWETLLALGIAIQLVKLIPGMAGKVLVDSVGGGGDAPPEYTIFFQAGRVIGNGPVLGGSF